MSISADTKWIIQCVCEGDFKDAQKAARNILAADKTETNRRFRETMLDKLDVLERKAGFIELPQNLKSLLVAESPENYTIGKFLPRDNERAIADKTLATYRASKKLIELGISYLPTLMLYGESGCGKTELARYIAHKANLPFVYVKFSNLVDSYLGGSQKNIGKVFDYVRDTPCVLCFDEIDTIGMARGQKGDVGEMNRIVISLMQEMDNLPGDVIIIGTTNRFDMLDKALVRRFSLHYEVTPLSPFESIELCDRFFGYTGIMPPNVDKWFEDNNLPDTVPAYKVIKACTEYIINRVIESEGLEVTEL